MTEEEAGKLFGHKSGSRFADTDALALAVLLRFVVVH